MRCLDRTLLPLSLAWLALAGCSDDGLAPPQDTDAMGSTSGTGVATLGESGLGPSDSSGPQSTGPATTSDPTSVTDDGPGSTETGAESTTGEPPPSMMCEMADQCVLVDDCCQCTALHVDDPPPACDVDCKVTMCASLGIADIGVVCEEGMCGLEARDCSGMVACDSLPPACPDGTLPEVGPGGNSCWTGACIPVEACDPVPGCEHCGEDEACVETIAQQGVTYSCRALPDECRGTATCECMPPDTCQAPFDACADADGVVQCSCPTC